MSAAPGSGPQAEAAERLGQFPLEIRPWHRLIRAAPWPRDAFKLPEYQAHRGFHLEGIQENTLEAFREAARRGAEICECDVQMNADGEPVVVHDSDLRRLFGNESRIRELTTAQVRALANIPTLGEALADPQGPAYFNIELKTRRIARSDLPARVAEVIRRAGAEKRVLFSSFNPFALALMQRLLPDAPRALLVTNVRHPDYSWVLREMLIAPFLKIHMLNLDKRMLNEEVMRFWSRQGVPIAAWTVNDRAEIREILRLGARSVISDLPPEPGGRQSRADRAQRQEKPDPQERRDREREDPS